MRNSTKGWPAAVVFAAAFSLGGGAARADVLAYEGFDYPAGAFLDGQAGGTGFGGPWVENNFGGFEDTDRDLIAPDSLPHGSLARTGNSVRVLGNYPNDSRPLTGTFDTGTLYVSFLMRQDSPGTDPANLGPDFGGIAVGNLFVGKGADSNFYVLEEAGVGNPSASSVSATVGQTALLVARIDFAAGPDTARLYVNPAPGAAEPATANATKSDLDVGTVDLVNILAGADAAWSFDEVRLGTTYADVVPVPEPAGLAAALLPAGAALLARRRARRAR